jgi:hypothetical protein
MNIFFRVITALLFPLILSSCTNSRAQALDDALVLTQPTLRTDGSALPTNQILQYEGRWGRTLLGPYTGGTFVIPGNNPAPTITANLSKTEGRRCYVVVTVDVNGLRSLDSNAVCGPFDCSTGKQPNNTTGLCDLIANPNPAVITQVA